MENNENLTKIIADNLTYYRKKANYTQQELATKINYSDKSISKWERGDGTPDIFILSQLAKLYGLSVNDFLTTKKKEKVANLYLSKLLITLMSVGLVWLIATITFITLVLVRMENAYLSFIYAIPISAIVVIVFMDVFFKRYYNVFTTSVLVWSLALCVFLTLKGFENIYMIFFVPIPLQVIIVLFYWLMYKKRKTNKL